MFDNDHHDHGPGFLPGCPQCQRDVAKADRQLRKDLEAIKDPALRKECLDAL